MLSPIPLPLLLLLLIVSATAAAPAPPPSQLSLDYYKKSCPQFSKVVEEVVIDKQESAPTTAAGTLRLFFHDCFVGGCDASLLIASNFLNKAERDSPANKDLPGDAFDLVVRAKSRLELECPGMVSCADILAQATRNLVSMVGGPYYPVRLGRRDGTISRAADVDGHLPLPNMTLTHIIDLFNRGGLNVQEMVALTGAHTIGFSHCSEFANRIFPKIDPTMNPPYANGLKKLCANYKKTPDMSAFNDPITPGKFDNMYYKNLQKGMGLLTTDQEISTDSRTKKYVKLYAANQTAFFEAFAAAIRKVSEQAVLTGKQGEVRRRCDTTNSLHVS